MHYPPGHRSRFPGIHHAHMVDDDDKKPRRSFCRSWCEMWFLFAQKSWCCPITLGLGGVLSHFYGAGVTCIGLSAVLFGGGFLLFLLTGKESSFFKWPLNYISHSLPSPLPSHFPILPSSCTPLSLSFPPLSPLLLLHSLIPILPSPIPSPPLALPYPYPSLPYPLSSSCTPLSLSFPPLSPLLLLHSLIPILPSPIPSPPLALPYPYPSLPYPLSSSCTPLSLSFPPLSPLLLLHSLIPPSYYPVLPSHTSLSPPLCFPSLPCPPLHLPSHFPIPPPPSIWWADRLPHLARRRHLLPADGHLVHLHGLPVLLLPLGQRRRRPPLRHLLRGLLLPPPLHVCDYRRHGGRLHTDPSPGTRSAAPRDSPPQHHADGKGGCGCGSWD